MTIFRIASALFLAGALAPVSAQATDTRAHVDSSNSNTVYYPPHFETSGEQGTVVLSVGVDSGGLISTVKVAQSSGHHDLDLAAIESAMNWHYIPATHDGDPHPDAITLRVVYDRPVPPAH